jgi:hypothetical protein
MRPRPSEIIAGVRTVLGDTIAPAVEGDHARARLHEVRAVLAQIDWDNAGFQLSERADRLGDALRDAQPWLAGELPPQPATREYAALEEYYERLAAVAVATLSRLRTARRLEPDDDAAAASHRALLRAL